MKKVNIEGIENAVSVRLFDLSVPLENRKPMIFDSKADAARHLGVAPSTLSKHIGVGKILSSPRQNKKYAIRINHAGCNSRTI